MAMLPAPQSPAVDLLRRVAAGDPHAVRDLLDASGDVVYGFVFARVGGDVAAAEDVVQDTYLEAVKSAHTFRGDAAVTTWLCAIARRRLARHYEAERRHDLARSGLTLVESSDGDDGEQVEVDRRDEVVRALGALPALHRQVLVLKYLDERSVEEIADELGRTRIQVQSLLQRARVGLRRQLEADDG
jgi:RNA polymerase sigma-70 factor (ECF subfamily)